MLELINVEKSYPSPADDGTATVLKDIILKIEKG